MKVNAKWLTHYGILGMHWGVRKGSSGSKGSTGIRRAGSADYERKLSLKNKRIKDMSNDELQEFTKRLQLESTYRKLTVKPKSAGRKIVEGMVNEFAKKALKDVTEKASAALLKKAMRAR